MSNDSPAARLAAWIEKNGQPDRVLVHPHTAAALRESGDINVYPSGRQGIGSWGASFPVYEDVNAPVGALFPIPAAPDYSRFRVPSSNFAIAQARHPTVELGREPDHVDKVNRALAEWPNEDEREVLLDQVEQLTGRREVRKGVEFPEDGIVTLTTQATADAFHRVDWEDLPQPASPAGVDEVGGVIRRLYDGVEILDNPDGGLMFRSGPNLPWTWMEAADARRIGQRLRESLGDTPAGRLAAQEDPVRRGVHHTGGDDGT